MFVVVVVVIVFVCLVCFFETGLLCVALESESILELSL